MLFTWKAIFEACVLRLLVCKVIDASFAKLLYLSEQPWRKALTLLAAWLDLRTQALCCISYSLICAKILKRRMPDCGETELEGLTQLMNVLGHVDRLGRGRFQHAGWEHKNFLFTQLLHLLLQLTCQCNHFGDSCFDFPLYLNVVCKPECCSS